MRVTKRYLQERLEAAIKHQSLDIVEVCETETIGCRTKPGFISAEQYGYGEVPLPIEIGKTADKRYVVRPW